MPTSHQPHFDIAAFYAFSSLPADNLKTISDSIQAQASKLNIVGLVILGPEGINATIAGQRQAVEEFLSEIASLVGRTSLEPKWSRAEHAPFRKFAVKIRDEIVTLGRPEIRPIDDTRARHLSPEAWQKELENPDVVVLDTRNWYETQMGKFKNAIDPRIDEFTEFPEYLAKSGIEKDKRVLIYCTGGIRCEKALLEMERQGFQDVYQLEGGILSYLEKFPNSRFEGDCFVFDHRVAVDQDLKPSGRYGLCPHCGQPATESIECLRCDSEAMICRTCTSASGSLKTCSKNCAHHWQLTPGKKGRPPANQGHRLSAPSRAESATRKK